MTTSALIQKYLPQDLWEIAAGYTIPDEFLEDAPDLIELILRSRSIDTEQEKQNWFNLLPLMNATQLEKLRAILIKEKTKLQEIEEKYEGKKQEIKKKYLLYCILNIYISFILFQILIVMKLSLKKF